MERPRALPHHDREWIKGTRWSLLKSPEKQTIDQLAKLGEVQQANKPLYRAFLLKEELRLLYQLDDPTLAPAHLDAWLTWASRSRLEPFVKLARTIRRYRDGILNAIRLGLNNARLEGLNSRIRLISHRSFGFHSPAPLIALIYLLLHRHPHPTPAMTFTPKLTGAPDNPADSRTHGIRGRRKVAEARASLEPLGHETSRRRKTPFRAHRRALLERKLKLLGMRKQVRLRRTPSEAQGRACSLAVGMETRFYFGVISPYSWFAAERIGDLLPQARWRPIFAGGLFRSVNRVSWGITPQRAARIEECEGRATASGLGPIRWPEGWPGNDILPARAMVAADRNDRLVPFALAAMRAGFQEGRDITQPEVIGSLAGAAGLERAKLLESAEDPEIKQALREINDEAVAAGVIGVPSVVVNGTVFWGDDRLHKAAAELRELHAEAHP